MALADASPTAAIDASPTAVADPVALAEALQARITRIRRAARRVARRPAELSALTGAQMELVHLVRRRPGISVADAAAELALAANTVSTLVRRLTADGVLVRAADPADRRVARLELAGDMRDTVAAWRDRRTSALGDAIAALDPAQRRRLADAMDALTHVADHLDAVA